MWPEAINRRALLALPLILAACGFAPVYAPGGVGRALRGRVTVEAPDTQDGFRLRARLEDRLGQTEAPTLRLAVDLGIDEVSAAVTPDGAITRYNLEGRAPWRLLAGDSGAVLAQGKATGFTGYSATGTIVATRSAEEDARERLMILLADDVVMRLVLLPPGTLP